MLFRRFNKCSTKISVRNSFIKFNAEFSIELNDFFLLSRCRHPACAPLMISISDEDYNRLPSCLNYVRSALDVNPGCKFGRAQQVNVIFNHKIPAEKNRNHSSNEVYKLLSVILDLGIYKLDLLLILYAMWKNFDFKCFDQTV